MRKNKVKNTTKPFRLQQLVGILKSNPSGIRRADIARRLDVHRSTVGRYIDQLSLTMPLWEKDNLIGLEPAGLEDDTGFTVYEGSFLLYLLRLYHQEVNVKNPHASSLMRKMAYFFKDEAPVLRENLLVAAETLELEEKSYSKGYVENYEKISAAWASKKAVKIRYLHRSTGETCSSIYEPLRLFSTKNNEGRSDASVSGYCRRAGENCPLNLIDFIETEYPVLPSDMDNDGLQRLMCPVSEHARTQRPGKDLLHHRDYSAIEANHRIKNSLHMASGLIDITFAGVRDAELDEKIKQLRSRIEAIASVHEQLSINENSGQMSLKGYLEKLIENSIAAHSAEPDKIRIRVKIDDISIDNSKALPLGMMISELITNSFKHSMTKDSDTIRLNIVKQGGVVRLRYTDGNEDIKRFMEKGRTGNRLFTNFCRQLGCTLKYENGYILLDFPV